MLIMSLTKMNKLDKSNVINTFTGLVEQLRSKECSQSEKIACFQQIAACIMSDALVANINYATHCSTAINVLLLFCEDLDSVVRMSAEENLNKIFRVLEKTRVSRILMDLYGEIKRNGNQRSLRICLNLFAHYVPQVREKHIKWYALRLLTCIETMAQRKETLLCETLCEFVDCFGKYLQSGLTDSETCKLFEAFMANIGVECAVKRRCSARNCISLIENSRNKSLMAKHGLNKVIELLLNDQRPQAVLGALVFLRLLLPLIIRGFTSDCNEDDEKPTQRHEVAKNIHKINEKMSTMPFECKQIIEIYDYCLHLLTTSNANANHSIINGALEVVSAVLQALSDQKSYNNNNNKNNNKKLKKCNNLVAQTLLEVLSNQNQLQHNEMLRKRKSLKNQIFQLENYHEMTIIPTTTTTNEQSVVIQDDDEQLTSKNMKIISADKSDEDRQELLTQASSSSVDAFKLEMQNIPYEQVEKALRAVACDENQMQKQQQQQQRQQIPQLDEIVSNDITSRLASEESFAVSTTTTTNVENEVNQDSGKKISIISKQDANDHHVDVIQVVRNTPRSISECVEDDSIILGGAGCMISDEKEGECYVEDDDDFTTLSEINEPQATFALTTKIDVDNLIDAMNATNIQTTENETAASVGATSRHLAVTSSISSTADDKSQLLSDIDNDSFNSIDFEAEITIAGLSTTSGKEKSSTCSTVAHSSSSSVGGYANLESKSSGSDTIGAFFNHLISQSNAASESVGKFFRQSSTSALKPTKKSSNTTNDPTESNFYATSVASSDSMSFVSNASSGVKVLDVNSPITATSLIGEDTASESASATASTALVADDNEKTHETAAGEVSSDEEVSKMYEHLLRTNRKTNPFLNDVSPLKETITGPVLLTCKIGSIHEQSLLRYTARLIAARFLLPHDVVDFLNDVGIRISIKSLSLIVLAQCVRLAPIVLDLSVEISADELSVLEDKHVVDSCDRQELLGSAKSSPGRDSHASTNVGSDYEHVEDVSFDKSQKESIPKAPFLSKIDEPLLLDIKDDHFGTGSNNYMFNTPPLSRSVDMVLLPTSNKIEENLSRSDIVSSPSSHLQKNQLAPRPPKRTKSMRKSPDLTKTQSNIIDKPTNRSRNVCDVLQYYNHADPVMRAGVQQLIGNYVQAVGGGSESSEALHLQYILALLINGLQDEIHTVVVQALNAFDKIFPYVVSKYLCAPPSMHHYILQKKQQKETSHADTMALKNIHEEISKKGENSKKMDWQQQQLNTTFLGCCTNDVIETSQTTTTTTSSSSSSSSSSTKISIVHQQQKQQQQQYHPLFTDNDELIDALLNAFQFQFQCNNNNNNNNNKNNNNNNKIKITNSNSGTLSSKIRTQSPISTQDDNSRQKNLNLFPYCISPKLLLNKLRLCYHHKYWLIQNKYIEVISNLNYTATLRSFYTDMSCMSDKNFDIYALDYVGDVEDLILAYEMQFLDELLQLLGDDDFRVREHAAFGLCRFIKSHAKQHLLKCNIKAVETESVIAESSHKKLTPPPVMPYILEETTCQTNFNLLWDFFDYHIFSGMPLQLRNLFRPDAAEVIDNCSYEDGTVEGLKFGTDVESSIASIEKRLMEEQKVLAKVLYQMTNKLMQLNDQNLQFGIIHALKVLLKHFNFMDYGLAYTEFNIAEICMKYARYNYSTAVDLNCQRDLIETMSKLIAGLLVNSSFDETQQQQQQQHKLLLQQLFVHTLKIINMYFYVFSNQKPLFFAKVHKSDLFSNAKELAIVQSIGYFGNDYTYIKLYHLLISANNSYKLSVSSESGVTFIALLKTCLNTLSLCIELSSSVDVEEAKTTMSASVSPSHTEIKEHTTKQHLAGNRGLLPTTSTLKLIEEVVQYLTKLINYAPSECITCVRQLLKYLFGENYGSRRKLEPREKQQILELPHDYDTLLSVYLEARRCPQYANGPFSIMSGENINCGEVLGNEFDASTHVRTSATEHYRCIGRLIAGALNVQSWKSEFESDCAKHIKLFEPIVVYCMTIFMKSDFRVQAPILELLSQLLEHNVTYSILDAKNVIFDQIVHNIELIERGIIRNTHIIIPPMIKFLVQLTHKSDRKLITIPKIISLTNNLLANNAISESALLALKCLAYEIFFVCPTTTTSTQPTQKQSPLLKDENNDNSTNSRNLELDTQREVILGMLEKFIDTVACQRVLGMLLLHQRCIQQLLDDPELYCGLSSGVVVPGGSKLTCSNNGVALLQSVASVESAVHRVLCGFVCADGRLQVDSWNGYLLLDGFFRNNCKNVLADSKDFLGLLQFFINSDVTKFSDLSHATIILANVILKTEEIYLVNHIKLYMKNNPNAMHLQFGNEFSKATGAHSSLLEGPSTSSAAAAAAAAATLQSFVPMDLCEIKYFAKVLCLKLCNCFNLLLSQTNCTLAENMQQYALIVRFVSALEEVCCRSSHKDALQSVFRLVLNESDFLDKYYNFLVMCSNKQKGGGIMGVYIHDDEGVREQQQLLQVEVFKLLSAMKLLNGMLLLQQIQTLGIKWNVQRTLLHEVCLHKKNAMDWNLEQVRQLFGLNVNALEFLIMEQFEFMLNLCSADEEFCSLFQNALLKYASALKQSSIRPLVHLIWRICSPTCNGNCSIQCVVKFLEFITELHRLHYTNKVLLMSLQRLVCKILATTSASNTKAISTHLKLKAEKNKSMSAKCILDLCEKHFEILSATNINEDNLNAANSTTATITSTNSTITTKFENIIPLDSRIIDEKWLYTQLIKFSTQTNYDAHQLTKILLEIQSEYKLHKIFNTPTFDVQKRVLRHAIAISLEAMLAEFRNKCIQHNPHIHYMQPNPLARVACSVLMARIESVLEQESVPLMGPAETKAEAESDGVDSVTCGNTASMAIECGFKLVSEAELNLSIGDNVDTYVYTNLVQCVIVYLEWLRNIEQMSLMFIEARFIERFLRENFLRDNQVCCFVRFIDWICRRATALLLRNNERNNLPKNHIDYFFRALDLLLQQKFIWQILNQGEQHGQQLLKRILQLIVLAAKKHLQNTNFYRQFMQKVPTFNKNTYVVHHDDDVGVVVDDERVHAENAIFIAKLIEALDEHNKNDVNKDFKTIETETSSFSINLLKSIGIPLLRTNQFYAYAVTPFEIMQQQLQMDMSSSNSKHSSPLKGKEAEKTIGKMPTIPLDSLSDVEVLRNFVKRLSIFGYTTRQQFEEYFMTFLLLINKVYDENMVDLQEQFQIKSTCLEAILELLITYKTFPIVGNKLSYFQHTTRWSRINCENISVKKLHKVQTLISSSNVFYHANLERQLTCDSLIGTKDFYYNQYDLNFVWQQMEAYTQSSPTASEEEDSVDKSDSLTRSSDKSDWTYGKHHTLRSVTATEYENVAIRNYRYYAALSGVDFKSSSQLIFDVLMQMIEHNHVMVLPNLLKFCEICESRDQIKWIKDKCMKLLETLPIDDTISHQHLIYLVCRTQAMLIPTIGELHQLCSLIGNYLKSSHVFIRNATLSGVLALLECCYKTNTTIGKLNDELDMLRDLIVGYINRHGIIDESSMNCCDTHLKLVWTLNFCLIEWTSKFVPQCHLLSNAIISASNFLRKTSNEDVYLCVLHGLERIVVNSGCDIIGSNNSQQKTFMGVVTPNLLLKIEKLALELVKRENEKFSIPALKLLLSCMYIGSSSQLEITELSNGIVQDDPEIIAQQTDKVDILLHCIKSSTRDAAWIYGQVLCQIIRDLVPPNEILTKVIKEFLVINQPHRDVIAMIVYQVFRSAIDSSFLQMLQDWLICSLPTFLALPEKRGVWSLSVIFISSSINLHLIKLFPAILRSERYTGGACNATNSGREYQKLGQHDIALFMTAAQDFHGKLSVEQKKKFKDAFKKFEEQHQVYAKMLHTL